LQNSKNKKVIGESARQTLVGDENINSPGLKAGAINDSSLIHRALALIKKSPQIHFFNIFVFQNIQP